MQHYKHNSKNKQKNKEGWGVKVLSVIKLMFALFAITMLIILRCSFVKVVVRLKNKALS